MKHNPDDRRDNVEKIQKNINKTIENTELADEMISKTSDAKMKKELTEKTKEERKHLME